MKPDKLQGFARLVRDFSERHDRDEKLRRSRARTGPVPEQSTSRESFPASLTGFPKPMMLSSNLVGYSREDLLAGRLHWPDLTPPEYSALDDLAHEEGLRFGACTPFEKELLRKDGTRVPVLVATAVLKLSPFRWITFVQDLRSAIRSESVGEEDVEGKQNFEEIVGQQRGVEADAAAGGSGRAHRRQRADPGRNRHRERTGRARHPPSESAQEPARSSP